ncbi:hypothetical protein HYQ46_007692 [Verticillium longisporum]|nr:hypothetical protein HYQ46_007692 [Verticillium longisporum]
MSNSIDPGYSAGRRQVKTQCIRPPLLPSTPGVLALDQLPHRSLVVLRRVLVDGLELLVQVHKVRTLEVFVARGHSVEVAFVRMPPIQRRHELAPASDPAARATALATAAGGAVRLEVGHAAPPAALPDSELTLARNLPLKGLFFGVPPAGEARRAGARREPRLALVLPGLAAQRDARAQEPVAAVILRRVIVLLATAGVYGRRRAGRCFAGAPFAPAQCVLVERERKVGSRLALREVGASC